MEHLEISLKSCVQNFLGVHTNVSPSRQHHLTSSPCVTLLANISLHVEIMTAKEMIKQLLKGQYCIRFLGSQRRLKEKTACLLVRVRGWHLDEKHILCDGEPMAGALVDFGLYFFHNVHIRLANGSAPYYYLPKMETHQETRLWNDVFKSAQDYMKVPQGELFF